MRGALGPPSKMSSNALFQMKLLDSVMRESQRWTPAAMIRFARRLEEDIVVYEEGGHDGQTKTTLLLRSPLQFLL